VSKEATRQYLTEQLEAMDNAQQMIVYCVHCPEWKAEGTALEARAAAEAHRTEEHPELRNSRKIVRKRRSFSQSMTEEREAEIEEERRKRMRALGIA